MLNAVINDLIPDNSYVSYFITWKFLSFLRAFHAYLNNRK